MFLRRQSKSPKSFCVIVFKTFTHCARHKASSSRFQRNGFTKDFSNMNNLQLTRNAYLENLIHIGEIDLRNAKYRYSFGVFPHNSDVFLRKLNKCLNKEKIFVPCPHCAIRNVSREKSKWSFFKKKTVFQLATNTFG